jgi:hypothetical protein
MCSRRAQVGRRALYKCLCGQPQVQQGKQRDQLCGVRGQPQIALVGVGAELALNCPKWLLDLGAHSGRVTLSPVPHRCCMTLVNQL